jgi:PLP dependent protein
MNWRASATSVSAETVAERLAEVRGRIAAAGGDPERVTVVAVTKGFDVSAVLAARASGITAIGENYAEELLTKAAAVGPDAVQWHYLGAVQRRKVGRLAPVVACWQSLSREEEGRAVAARAAGAAVFVEVDTTGIPGRLGVRPEQAGALVENLRGLGLRVQGLMTVALPGPPEAARPGFRAVSRLSRELGLDQLSAGMSDDLEVAVSEGSTMVRVGRALFGPRPATGSQRPPAPDQTH